MLCSKIPNLPQMSPNWGIFHSQFCSFVRKFSNKKTIFRQFKILGKGRSFPCTSLLPPSLPRCDCNCYYMGTMHQTPPVLAFRQRTARNSVCILLFYISYISLSLVLMTVYNQLPRSAQPSIAPR